MSYSKLKDGLWIGDHSAALDHDFIVKQHITYFINCGEHHTDRARTTQPHPTVHPHDPDPSAHPPTFQLRPMWRCVGLGLGSGL